MKPVAILQHDSAQQPGYLLNFLASNDVPVRVLATSEGDAVPRRASDWSGLVLLGSPNSVNDRLPWIAAEAALVRDAFSRDVAVLGHCFGGQLMARCLGAEVGRCPWPNIGFSPVKSTPLGRAYCGVPSFLSFHWHYETFGIPRGAQRAFFFQHVLNEGFVYGKHLALQSHLEVTEMTIRRWCRQDKAELVAATGPWAQKEAEIMNGLDAKVDALHEAAERIYAAWAAGIERPPLHRVRPTSHLAVAR